MGRSSFDQPPLTVILLTREPGDREIRTAELVRGQDYAGDVTILVIDSSPDHNGPKNLQLAEIADRRLLVKPEEFHHSTTRNLGVEHTGTPIVVFLSSDAHPVNDRWLSELVRPLIEETAEVSYGRQRPPEADAEREATYSYLYPDEPHLKTKSSVAGKGIRAIHFSDVTSAYLTRILKEVPFPSEIPIFQDAAICKLVLDAGYRIAYVPTSEVYHAHPMTWRGMWARYRGLGEVYQRYGMFDEAAGSGGSLVKDGFRSIGQMAPRFGKSPIKTFRTLATFGIKALATAQGRRDARNKSPLGLDWSADGGSRAVRR